MELALSVQRLFNALLILTVAIGPLAVKLQGAIERYFPQAIRGDLLNTTRILVWDLEPTPAAVTIQFFNQAGQLVESRNSLLEGNGSQEITLGAPIKQIIGNNQLMVGWISC